MVDVRARAMKTLERGYLMSLGTVDNGGVWVSDVIYIFDDALNIYWMSDPDARHSKAIEANSQGAGTVTVNAAGQDNLGVQFSGCARKIEGPRFDLALKHYAKRGKPAPAESDDVLQGDAWYMLTPEVMELIDEENFGFTKQRAL